MFNSDLIHTPHHLKVIFKCLKAVTVINGNKTEELLSSNGTYDPVSIDCSLVTKLFPCAAVSRLDDGGRNSATSHQNYDPAAN